MKNFWALPAVLRVAVASKHAFSVHDDILAFPQYDVQFSRDFIHADKARDLLRSQHAIKGTRESSTTLSADNQDVSAPWSTPASSDRKPGYLYEDLIDAQGQRQLCRIPLVQPEVPDTTTSTNSTVAAQKAEEQKELERANTRGWQLLSQMQGQCLYYWSGWWSYRYCFGGGVRQFHQLPPQPGLPFFPPTEDPNEPVFMLGQIGDGKQEQGSKPGADWDDDEDSLAETEKHKEAKKVADLAAVQANGSLETSGEVHFLVQRLAGGTVCDMTGHERRIEVQFHCSPSDIDRITMIKETSTCKYLMVINTPRLCSDVAFLPPKRDKPNAIECSPILEPGEVDNYLAKQAARVKRSIEHEASAASAEGGSSRSTKPLPRVGNVVVGAHKYIPEGREIKKTAIVGGGMEHVVAVVADSDGNMMSHAEIKDLEVSPADVERLKEQLERIASKTGWHIEVVDHAQGRDLRGLVGKEDGAAAGEGEGAAAADDGAKKPPPDSSERERYEKNKYDAGKFGQGGNGKPKAATKQKGDHGGVSGAAAGGDDADKVKGDTAPPEQTPDFPRMVHLDEQDLGMADGPDDLRRMVLEHLRKANRARREEVSRAQQRAKTGHELVGGVVEDDEEEAGDDEAGQSYHQDGDVVVVLAEGDDEAIARDEL